MFSIPLSVLQVVLLVIILLVLLVITSIIIIDSIMMRNNAISNTTEYICIANVVLNHNGASCVIMDNVLNFSVPVNSLIKQR